MANRNRTERTNLTQTPPSTNDPRRSQRNERRPTRGINRRDKKRRRRNKKKNETARKEQQPSRLGFQRTGTRKKYYPGTVLRESITMSTINILQSFKKNRKRSHTYKTGSPCSCSRRTTCSLFARLFSSLIRQNRFVPNCVVRCERHSQIENRSAPSRRVVRVTPNATTLHVLVVCTITTRRSEQLSRKQRREKRRIRLVSLYNTIQYNTIQYTQEGARHQLQLSIVWFSCCFGTEKKNGGEWKRTGREG